MLLIILLSSDQQNQYVYGKPLFLDIGNVDPRGSLLTTCFTIIKTMYTIKPKVSARLSLHAYELE